MSGANGGSFGYTGRWAFVDLTGRTVRIEEADERVHRLYIGGRGVQARLIHEHLKRIGPLRDPLSPENRIILGTSAPNDTAIPTAGRGSCSFISPMTRSPEPAAWIPGHRPVLGMITHSSAGGQFPNMLKRAGFDQVVIDGRADRPVRLLVEENGIRILDAEDDLFEIIDGRRIVRPVSVVTDILTARHPGSSTMCLGPAGWNQVVFACLTGDHHRNFGRGGAGAVFGSKNLVAVTAAGGRSVRYADPAAFQQLVRELDNRVKAHVGDPLWTASFRPTTGTTWWLDRAFNGGYLGKQGGYLPWHNFDEGGFDPAIQAEVGTAAFLEISGRHSVCNRCRHILCTRTARVDSGLYAGSGIRPEFETTALFINCCLTDRAAIFHINRMCNELGVDTMTFGNVASGAMDLEEHGFLKGFPGAPRFGDAPSMARFLEDIAYGRGDLGPLFGRPTDAVISELGHGAGKDDLARCLVTAYGGLGYAGIEPKAFPGMFAAYGTSNRGRGDHTYAWTIQAEEGGLAGTGELAAYVAGSQTGKALVDSLGLCDFFTEDVTSDLFIDLLRALTGWNVTAGELKTCGTRIYTLERRINNLQGRTRAYDAYVPPKFTTPMTAGALRGRAVDPEFHGRILDAYYSHYGWTGDGRVPDDALKTLEID